MNEDWKTTVEYAGVGVRFKAFMMDSLVMLIPLAMVLDIFFSWVNEDRDMQKDAMMQTMMQHANSPDFSHVLLQSFLAPDRLADFAVENTVSLLLTAALTIAFWVFYSATPGKMWGGLKIVDAETGLPPTPKQDIIRYLGYFVSSFAMMFGFLAISWDKRKQGWHDKMAGTVVVVKKTLPEELRFAVRKDR